MIENSTIFRMSDVSVSYGFRRAVAGLSVELNRGESLGLLGANGAGKTSTIRALLGMLKYRGKIELFGLKRRGPTVFRRVGFAPEEGVPPEYLSGREYLRFVGHFRVEAREQRNKEVEELLEWFELEPEKRVHDYSKGMKKRLVLAQTFLGTPEFLILDEPLNGLDPLMIIKLRDRLEKYREAGGSLLYSSHILSEIEKTCTRIAIIDKGVLVCCLPIADLLQEFGSVEAAFAAKVGKS